GLEGLLRWEHQRLGPIRNARCVALAEATGLILPLGNWLLRSVCEQIVRWSPPSGKPDLPLGVALTSSQSGDSDLVGAVLNILRETALPPDRLHLGLPTATLAADRGDAVDNLRVLADSGVRIVLHDFGATPGE